MGTIMEAKGMLTRASVFKMFQAVNELVKKGEISALTMPKYTALRDACSDLLKTQGALFNVPLVVADSVTLSDNNPSSDLVKHIIRCFRERGFDVSAQNVDVMLRFTELKEELKYQPSMSDDMLFIRCRKYFQQIREPK